MKTFKALSALLSYPDSEWLAEADALMASIAGEELLPDPLIGAIEAFIGDLAAADLLDAQERYVALFDRHRSLSLHLYEHVHGESRDRGQAMVNLAMIYRLHGVEIGAIELPDYLPLFLEFLSLLPLKAAASLLSEAAPIVAALSQRLRERGSAYARVLEAVEALAAKPAERIAVADILAVLKPEDDSLEALDRQWEEEAVRFTSGAGPDGGDGASRCGR